jgi:hypothetical protein
VSAPAVVTEEAAVAADEPAVAPLATDTPLALQAPTPTRWIFSAPIDLAVFALPALVALALIAWLAPERARDESPTWVWITGVLLVDVAHVWSTAFITYLDPTELRRHPERYGLVPGLAWVAGVLLYGIGGAGLFWRVLAYVAVFHFVRQQYGWMALYRARARERGRIGGWIDGAAIYAATLYPLLWWHTHLPRRFAWFVDGDFLGGLPRGVSAIAGVLYVTSLGAYGLRAVLQGLRGELILWGKHLLLAATAVTWYVGIVATDDDVAFTLTNVLAHGVPYAVLVFSYGRFTREGERERGVASRVLAGRPGAALLRLLACVWLLAYVEELLWDRTVWHERPELFGGGGLEVFSGFEAWLVPLLVLPQVSHYLLDGFFWRRGGNPRVGEWLRRGG